jgi:hypothetical protein
MCPVAPTRLPGDTNGQDDIVVRDADVGALERVNVADDGSQAMGGGSWNTAASRVSGSCARIPILHILTAARAAETGKGSIMSQRVDWYYHRAG